MKFSTLSLDLKKNLNIISRGISNKPHLPILSGLLLKAKSGVVSMESTDLEISFWVNLPASIEEEGEVVVPAKLFTELITSLPSEKIEIEVIANRLKVKTKNVVSELICQGVDDFPVIPRAKKSSLVVDSNEFKEKMGRLNVSVAKEDTRPILTGVLWSLKDTSIILAATDGFRLTVESLSLSKKPSEDVSSYVIPSRSLLEVSKAISETAVISFGVEFDSKNHQVIFTLGSMEISTRLLDGDFPPYQQIIPNTYNTKISVDKELLLSAVKRASLFARDNANVVKVLIEGQVVKVMAENNQVGSNVTEIESNVEGNDLSMAFNARYLLDYLSILDTDNVEWETEGELKPSVFRNSTDPDWLQVVMPIRVQG